MEPFNAGDQTFPIKEGAFCMPGSNGGCRRANGLAVIRSKLQPAALTAAWMTLAIHSTVAKNAELRTM